MPEVQMTSKERLLAALRGDPVDRAPWSPFLAYWWECQPKVVRQAGQFNFLRALGADPLLRGSTVPFACSDVFGFKAFPSYCQDIPDVNFSYQEQGDEVCIRYETRVGTLETLARKSAQGNTIFVTQHPIRSREDYKTLRFLIERMEIRPDYSLVEAEIALAGQDGLSVPVLSPFLKTPFQSLVEHFLGAQQLSYDLADMPEEIETTLELMAEKALHGVQIAIDSRAEVFILWEDTSTTNVSPRQFQRYIAPQINQWGQMVHAAGKLLLHHACGHVRALLPQMADEEVDAIESLSPPPTGNVEVWEAQAVLGEQVGIVGGIEPVNFLNLDLPELQAYVLNLLERIDPRHYVLANSDSCPPGVTVEKFRLVTDLVRAHKFG